MYMCMLGCILCHFCDTTHTHTHTLDGHLVLESVKFPGQHVGVRDSGDAKEPNHTGRGKHAQFTVKVIKEQPEYYYAGKSLVEVGILLCFSIIGTWGYSYIQ